jgi:hypothetical protein
MRAESIDAKLDGRDRAESKYRFRTKLTDEERPRITSLVPNPARRRCKPEVE